MNLIKMTILAKLRRQKTRLAFVLLAITAASCLVVWMIGGYQSLFTEAMDEDTRILGRYDLKLSVPNLGGPGMSRRGGGMGMGAFGGPFAGSGPEKGDNSKNPAVRGNGGPGMGGPGTGSPGMGGPGTGSPGMGGPGTGGLGTGGSQETAPRKRYDPFKASRNERAEIDLARLPEILPNPIRKKLTQGDLNGDGLLNAEEEKRLAPPAETSPKKGGPAGARGFASGGPSSFGPAGNGTIPKELADALHKDSHVLACDRIAAGRAFIYSPNLKRRSIDPLREGDAAEDSLPAPNAPEGIDPELHRKGLTAYRGTMGTPLSFGQPFLGTDAPKPPYDLEAGRWFDAADSPQSMNSPKSAKLTLSGGQAVLTKKASEEMNASCGDKLLLINKNGEFQLEIIGVLDDSVSNSLYVTLPMLAQIMGAKESEVQASELRIELADGVSPEAFKAEFCEAYPDYFKTSGDKGGDVGPKSPEKAGKERGNRQAVGGKGIRLDWVTEAEAKAQRGEERRESNRNLFQYQAVSGSLLSVLASIFIIFTALNMGVEEDRRVIALYRAVGLTRGQIAFSILGEALLLAIPGWLGGLGVGWLVLWLGTGKAMTLNGTMTLFSFAASVVGAVFAAFLPMMKGCRVRPMEALGRSEFTAVAPLKKRLAVLMAAILGAGLIAFDLVVVYVLPMETAQKAYLHSGYGVLALILGILLWIPALIRMVEIVFTPVLAILFGFERNLLKTELSGNLRRTTGTVLALGVGLGLYVSMQIWGYSMLGPFLPNREMPDALAAFLPTGLRPESLEELQNLPFIKKGEFQPIALEQAAFTAGTVTPKGAMAGSGSFANVIFFGMDVDASFLGPRPLVGMKFIAGDKEAAFAAMKSGRGCVINDAVTIDYGLKLGDTLKVDHPKRPGVVLEYPIVGVVEFNGWQWLSKTSGVRRNFGRSGGIVFADRETVWKDFNLDRFAYFWFNTDGSKTLTEMEADLDRIAQKNFNADKAERAEKLSRMDSAGQRNLTSRADFANQRDFASGEDFADRADSGLPPNRGGLPSGGEGGRGTSESVSNAAYAKLSTRDSLDASISGRADSVIWGMCVMPLVTLAITSIAVVGVVTNSVRSRRWQFGMMRAVGVSRGAILRMILAESLLIGLTAAAASLLFGYFASAGALKLGRSVFGSVNPPLILPWKGLTLGFGLTFALCLLAALGPAIKTGFQKPLELLQEGRGEN